MSLAVVCPSRGRPQYCARMISSVIDSSRADVLIYFDDDDPTHPIPEGAWNGPRVRTLVGPRIGRGAAINTLCQMFQEYRAYLLISDDITFVRNGWDKDVLAGMDHFSNDIGLVHIAYSHDHQFVSWPCISRKWIDAVGWFNPPTLKSYCQDTALQALGEALDMVVRVYPAIEHSCIAQENGDEKLAADMEAFLWFMALDFGPALKKLRGKT